MISKDYNLDASGTDSELGRISKPFQKMEVQKTFFVCLRQNTP